MSTPATMSASSEAPPSNIQDIWRFARQDESCPDSSSFSQSCSERRRDLPLRRFFPSIGASAGRGTTNGGGESSGSGILNNLRQPGQTTPRPSWSSGTRNTNRQSGHTNPLQRRALSMVSGTPETEPPPRTTASLGITE
jgi:hypothetical protein